MLQFQSLEAFSLPVITLSYICFIKYINVGFVFVYHYAAACFMSGVGNLAPRGPNVACQSVFSGLWKHSGKAVSILLPRCRKQQAW